MADPTMQSLHEATLILLERVGVRVESEAALALLADSGVRVDWSTQRVHLRQDDIQRALATVPRAYRVYGRRTTDPLTVGDDHAYIISGGGSLRVLTLDGRYEPATWEHLRQFNILLDALPNIHICINQVDPQDDSGERFYARLAAEMLIGLPKPCSLQAGSAADVAAAVEMGVAIRGSREALAAKPVFKLGANAEPPLCIPKHAAEILIAACQAGVPSGIGDYGMMGITAPRTVAGAVIQVNAVELVTLVLSQIARPGAAIQYTAFTGSGNMRTLDPITADPATLQYLRLAAQLGRSYGLPVYSVALTDARNADPQAAAERALQLQIVLDAGANLIQGPTSHMDQMMLSSYAQAIIDNDIVGSVLASRVPPEVSPETLALDVIEDVVGDPSLEKLKFAAHPHTVRHLRDNAWEPLAFSYDSFSTWQQAGSQTVVERATAVARDILAHHQPEPLAPEIAKEIRRIAKGGV